jgi:hypothetical protein
MSEELPTEIDNLRIEIDKNVAMPEASGDDATNDATLMVSRWTYLKVWSTLTLRIS